MSDSSEKSSESANPNSESQCDPETEIATRTEFRLANKKKPLNFIWGELVDGELSFIVENKPKDGKGCRGKWLFEQMLVHYWRRC